MEAKAVTIQFPDQHTLRSQDLELCVEPQSVLWTFVQGAAAAAATPSAPRSDSARVVLSAQTLANNMGLRFQAYELETLRLFLVYVICGTTRASQTILKRIRLPAIRLLFSNQTVSWIEKHAAASETPQRLAKLWRGITTHQPNFDIFTLIGHGSTNWDLRGLVRLQNGAFMLPNKHEQAKQMHALPKWFCPDFKNMSFDLFSKAIDSAMSLYGSAGEEEDPRRTTERAHGLNLLCLIQQYLQQCRSLVVAGSLDPALWYVDNQGLWYELYAKMRIPIFAEQKNNVALAARIQHLSNGVLTPSFFNENRFLIGPKLAFLLASTNDPEQTDSEQQPWTIACCTKDNAETLLQAIKDLQKRLSTHPKQIKIQPDPAISPTSPQFCVHLPFGTVVLVAVSGVHVYATTLSVAENQCWFSSLRGARALPLGMQSLVQRSTMSKMQPQLLQPPAASSSVSFNEHKDTPQEKEAAGTIVINDRFDIEKLKSGAFRTIRKVRVVNRQDPKVVFAYVSAHCPDVNDLDVSCCTDGRSSSSSSSSSKSTWTQHLDAMALTKLSFFNCRPFTDATLFDVSKLTGLQYLSITGLADVTDSGIAHLSTLTLLQQLYLMNSKHVTTVAVLKHMPLLRNVSISLHALNNEALAVLGEAPQLETLWLGSLCAMTSDGFRHLGKPGSNLQELTIAGDSWSGYLDTRDLSCIPRLRKLGLTYVRNILSLKQGSLNNKLVSLNLNGSELPADTDLRGMNSLESLELHTSHGLTDPLLRQCATLQHLASLDISAHDGVTATVFDILASAPRLTDLTLARCKEIKTFGSSFATGFKTLQVLDLANCGMQTDLCVLGAMCIPSLRFLHVHEDDTMTDHVRIVAASSRLELVVR